MKLPLVLTALIHCAVSLHGATRDLLKHPDPWFASAEAKDIADRILSYQSDYGGWPKNTDLTAKRFEGSRNDLKGELRPCFDNGATVDEIRFMARMYLATKKDVYRTAVEDGLDYIFVSQYSSGGWPQSYPPDSTYHRHITFNDDAMVRVLTLVREVAESKGFDFVDTDRRQAARSAFHRGLECILKCQIRVNGKLTAWCAQHDEVSYVPRPGRTFELASISGAESAKILRLLMSIEKPAPEIVQSIEAALEWFKQSRLTGWRVLEAKKSAEEGKNFEAVADPGAKPLWARFYDLRSNQPLFAGRDGKPHPGIENVGWARRGYDWVGTWPQNLLEKEEPKWRERLAKSGTGPALEPWKPKVRIALAGDSTVTDSAGWGFGFKKALAADVFCENFAKGGQSTKSFRDTGWWDRTLKSKPDYVLIQFGHNDMPGKGPHRETDPATTYPENLARFVAEARAAGIKPVLLTSLVRRLFLENGKLRGELKPYADAASKGAAEQNVPLIDLFAKSTEHVEKLGLKGVLPYEPTSKPKPAANPSQTTPGTKPVFPGDIDFTAPAGSNRDATHLNGRGSAEFGAIIARELQVVVPELKDAVRKVR